MRKTASIVLALILAVTLCACVAPAQPATEPAADPTAAPTEAPVVTPAETAVPTPAPTEAISDVEPLLYLTRGEITEQIGAGEPQPYGDISDYNESGYALDGFPCAYSNLKGIYVFFDGEAPAEDAAPYDCVPSPTDTVFGIMLPPESEPFHVRGMTASLKPEQVKQIEHVDGMYEFYRIITNIGNLQFEWRSDNADMSSSTLYVSQLPSES